MIIPKRFYMGQPSTSNTAVYTVPSATKAIVKNVILTNTTGTEASITLHFVPNGSSAGSQNKIISSYPVEGNDTVVIDFVTTLEPSDAIHLVQNTSSAITVTISGVEVS